jgi:hypothetical protein
MRYLNLKIKFDLTYFNDKMVTDVEYITFVVYYDREQTFYLLSTRLLLNADSHAHIDLASLYSASFFSSPLYAFDILLFVSSLPSVV